jgi:spore germination protein GerM
MKLKAALMSVVVGIASLVLPQVSTVNATAGEPGSQARTKKVKVYFYHEPGEYIDLSPVERRVSAVSPARAAINALLQGPNENERSRGFEGLSGAEEFAIGSLKISRGTARINFVASRTWAGFAGDLAPVRFKKAVEMTLMQFPNVRRVIVTLNGDRNFEQ